MKQPRSAGASTGRVVAQLAQFGLVQQVQQRGQGRRHHRHQQQVAENRPVSSCGHQLRGVRLRSSAAICTARRARGGGLAQVVAAGVE